MTGLLLQPAAGMKQVSSHWYLAKDGNATARRLFHRHYSYRPYADGRRPLIFVGPGEKMVLINMDGTALFVWRRFQSADGQTGVNCAIFRNESGVRSSLLILEAEDAATARWGETRAYTYVNPRKIISSNPGYCFQMAGWKKRGTTRWNKLLVLDKHLTVNPPASVPGAEH